MPHPYLRRHFAKVQNGRFKAQSTMSKAESSFRDPNWKAENYIALQRFSHKVKKQHDATLLVYAQTQAAIGYLLHSVSVATDLEIMTINASEWLANYRDDKRTRYARLVAEAESLGKVVFLDQADELFHVDSPLRWPADFMRYRVPLIVHCRWEQDSATGFDEVISQMKPDGG